MSLIRSISCNHCGFQPHWGPGFSAYVQAEPGRLRRLLGLPGKKIMIREPAVSRHSSAKDRGDVVERRAADQIGFVSVFVCRDCLKVFERDVKGDRRCRKCGSDNVVNIFEIVGHACPRCGRGRMTQKILGIT